jgi:predicted MFS family arabinose efflux permease
MTTTATIDRTDPDALARRNARLLAAAVGIGGGLAPVNIALGGIVGGMLSGAPALATLPVTAYVLGAFLTSMPASLLMAAIGRKQGFALGGAIGVTGGLVAAAGVVAGSFALFIVGSALCGSYHGFNQLYRFAAADTATPAFKPKAISWVMIGGLISAVVGPQIVINAQGAIPVAPLAGPYVAGSLAVALAMIPVLLTRFPAFADQPGAAEPARPLGEIARQPRFVVAVVVGMVAYALMNLVMTASPLAMIVCGHSVADAALGIQWHIIGMFAPSFFTGALIARFGLSTVMAAGLVLLAGSGLVAIAGITLWHFWIALVLLGVGWNFAYVGATTMVTGCHRPSERGKVQGLNDSLVFGLVAIASLSAGWLQNASGWIAVNLVVFPAVAVALAALAYLAAATRRAAAA